MVCRCSPFNSVLKRGVAPFFRAACAKLFIFLVVSGLFVAGPVYAQVQSNPSRPGVVRTPLGELYSVEGLILSADGGGPISHARLTLRDFQGRSIGTTITDDDGMFTFYDLPPGRYLMEVTSSGYPEHTEQIDLSVAPIRGLRVMVPKEPSKPTAPPGATLPVWAQAIPPAAQKEYDEGMKAFQSGDRKKCVAHLEAAVHLYPDYASAYSGLGMAWMGLKKNDDAKKAFESALKIDENLADANLFLGGLYNAEKRYADAEKCLLRARLLRPDEWRVHHELGEVYWRTEKWASAEASLREAVRLHEGLPRTHLLLMNVLAIQEKYPDALKEMEDFLHLFPDDPFATQVRQKHDLLKKEIQAHAGAPAPPVP